MSDGLRISPKSGLLEAKASATWSEGHLRGLHSSLCREALPLVAEALASSKPLLGLILKSIQRLFVGSNCAKRLRRCFFHNNAFFHP